MDVESIDWEAYVALAMGDDEFGPRPAQLCHAANEWNARFKAKHGRDITYADEYPKPFADFLKQLAKHPLKNEAKDKPGRKKGRPRLDQKKWTDIHRAWLRYIFTEVYEMNLELYQIFGRGEHGVEVTDFDLESFKGERPSILAMEKLANRYGVSVDMVRDIIFPNRRKKR